MAKRWMWAFLVLLKVAGASLTVTGDSQIINLTESSSPREPVNVYARSLTVHCLVPTGSRCSLTFYFVSNDTTSSCFVPWTPDRPGVNFDDQSCQNNISCCRNNTWRLLNVSQKNNGLYSCLVKCEVPTLKNFTSGEVKVHIVGGLVENTTFAIGTTTKAPPTREIPLWLWVSVSASAVVAIILIALCALCMRRCSRDRDAEEPVYANTANTNTKQRSSRPRADRLKPTDSCHNLRTPSPARRYEEGKQRPRP